MAIATVAASAGALVSSIAPTPIAPLIGAPLVAAIESLGSFIAARQGRKLEDSVRATAETLVRLDRLGYVRRSDDFFEDKETYGSDFEELAESMFKAVVGDDESRKAPLFGILLARSVLIRPAARSDEILQRSDAIALAKLGKELSYRQLCMIGLIGNAENDADGKNFRFYMQRNVESGGYDRTMAMAYEEFRDLTNRDLLDVSEGLGATPTIATLVGSAILLYEEMDLSNLPDEHLREVKLQLGSEP